MVARLLSRSWTIPPICLAVCSCGLVVGVGFAPAGAPTARGCIESFQFASDHQLLRQSNGSILTAGEPCPLVHWRRTPAVNIPSTHTAGARAYIRARLTVSLESVPEGTPFLLEGHSAEPALCFRQPGTSATANQLALALAASQPLGKSVRKLRQPIRWTLTLHPGTDRRCLIELGSTGPHLLYTTPGRPQVTGDPRTLPTEPRMELTVRRLAAAQAKQGLDASVPWLVYELMKQNGDAYLPDRHYGGAQAWRLPQSWTLEPKGASCVSIVEFVGLLCRMAGLEGDFATVAFYSRETDPKKPVLGPGLGDPPITRKGPGNETWQLFLVDDTNTAKGQQGGLGGMNFYEAALQLDWRGRRFFYPGGTDRVYAAPEHVLMVFRTLAWAAYDFQIGHWVVREVVHTYSRPGQKQPPSVPLP